MILKFKDFLNESKELRVYHGGNISTLKGPLFVSEFIDQAKEYAKGHTGKMNSFLIDGNKIAQEKDAMNIILSLGLKSRDEEWQGSEEDLNIYELIDPNFETSLSDKDIKLVYQKLEKKGFESLRFLDMNLKSLKNDISNIVVFDSKYLIKI